MSAPLITRLDPSSFDGAIDALADLLVDAVDGNASVGFHRPLRREDAASWWRSLRPEIVGERTLVLVARVGERIVGTVQLRLAQFPNGRHRADVAKLLVHRDVRRRGIARALMTELESLARSRARTLLVLDTETDSEADRLYRALGWTFVGEIPGYAEHPDGSRPTSFFFKEVR